MNKKGFSQKEFLNIILVIITIILVYIIVKAVFA